MPLPLQAPEPILANPKYSAPFRGSKSFFPGRHRGSGGRASVSPEWSLEVNTATNSTAGATYSEMGPEQLLEVRGLASSAGAPSQLLI
jgi:hypothetical protein